ncbi:MAG: NTP transferase domain-containing protein [Pirellulaceae bacterium]|nr:NTP transferase domain-containing protein [Pirellulaceae bacterium]
MLNAVIMAGGAGTRFWPESRTTRPKQLLGMTGSRTMIQATTDRLGDLAPPERTYVATTAVLADQIAAALPELPPGAILVEPCKRDTGPCIGLAAAAILRKDPDAVMAVMPSDHVIGPDESFQEAIRFAASLVEQDRRRLVTFGIRPTYPAETFGYIERAEPLADDARRAEKEPAAFAVKKFHEKPKADVAARYVESGNFYWNAGIFVWRADTILETIARFQPKIIERLDRIADAVGTPEFDDVLQREFALIEPISIDLGVMERAENVVVVEAPFEWDDVGSWRALERLGRPDADGNVIDAQRHIAMKTTGSIIRAREPGHLVVTMGVEDLIVIVTPDATLVADKHDEESIRKITQELRDRGWSEYL